MNILLDECVDRRLARDLVGHLVSTVPKMGWAGIKNGVLLALAEKEFEAFVTVDRKISAELVTARPFLSANEIKFNRRGPKNPSNRESPLRRVSPEE